MNAPSLAAPPLAPIGALLFESWNLYKSRLASLWLIGGLGFAGAFAAGAVVLLAAAPLALLGASGAYFWSAVAVASASASLWIASWAQVAMMESVLEIGPGKGVAGWYRASWVKIIPVTWVCLVYLIVIMGGFWLFVIPGVYLGVALVFAPLACAAEGVGGLEALERSLFHVRGRWLSVSGRLALIGFLSWLPSQVPWLGILLGAIAAPFALSGSASLYADLRRVDAERPFLPSWRTKAAIAGCCLGLVFPVGMAYRTLPLVLSEMKGILEKPLDPAVGERIIKILQENPDADGIFQAYDVFQSSAAAGGGAP